MPLGPVGSVVPMRQTSIAGRLCAGWGTAAPAGTSARIARLTQTHPSTLGSWHTRCERDSLLDLELVLRRQLWKRSVRLPLVPVDDRADVVLERKIAVARAPPQSLNRDLQVALEPDRVGDVPAVETEALLRLIEAVGTNDQRHPRVGSGELLVLLRLPVLEVVRAAEVVLGAGADDRGGVLVAVHVELDLAFSPPAVVVDAVGHVRADVVSLALDSVDQRVDLFVGEGIDPTELRVEIALVLSDVGQRVGDLVVERHLFFADVLERDARALAKRHDPVAVERAAGIDADGERRDLRGALPAGSEEVADRRLHRRRALAVPVHAEDRVAPRARRRHPDVLDGPHAFDVGEREYLAGLDDDRGRDL